MKTSQLLLATTREVPTDAKVISHRLMLRAGMIRSLASGLYTWLPLGLRVLRKVEHIIREEMDAAGAQEVLMPVVQPAELWQESERWEAYGPELLRFKDRHQRDFVLGPTHEEVITDLVRKEIRSYKQLPANFYQIQTKFRDEIRPRFGVMRAREFIMKDAYSFHLDRNSLAETYQVMYDTYNRIFTRLGLDFRPVLADTGAIGGDASHEFHVLANSGEDAIAFSSESDYAANVELAEALPPQTERPAPTQPLEKVDTPKVKTVEEVSAFLNVPPQKILKTLIVKGATEQAPLVALCLRGDHELNEIKAEKHPLVAAPLTFATDADIISLSSVPGFIGPVGLNIPVIADHSAAVMADFVSGAHEKDRHYTGTNWGRDTQFTETADLRNVVEGDPSPDGKGVLKIRRGIEVGHIFQLGDKYTQALNATVLNEQGKATVLQMGCYGIGVSRVVAAAIEQNHDDKGIIWPDTIAPFQVALVPMQLHKSPRVREAAEKLYATLRDAGIEVLFDDRNERPGVMFNDMELIGIPHRLVIGDRGLDKGVVEYKNRRTGKQEDWPLEEVLSTLQQRLKNT